MHIQYRYAEIETRHRAVINYFVQKKLYLFCNIVHILHLDFSLLSTLFAVFYIRISSCISSPTQLLSFRTAWICLLMESWSWEVSIASVPGHRRIFFHFKNTFFEKIINFFNRVLLTYYENRDTVITVTNLIGLLMFYSGSASELTASMQIIEAKQTLSIFFVFWNLYLPPWYWWLPWLWIPSMTVWSWSSIWRY